MNEKNADNCLLKRGTNYFSMEMSFYMYIKPMLTKTYIYILKNSERRILLLPTLRLTPKF